jgi:hypothetical protein
MASFLFRFYNGSSSLKLIPPSPAMLAEAFLSFDEDVTDQVPVEEALSYGQPTFPQLQMVSNAYEVRTPYYRGVRCDVINSNQVPVLGDVRTNIRMSNLSGFGSVNAPTSMFEAAGDDFSFFFMVGPPPMCDIRNVTSYSTFPTGVPVALEVGGITSITVDSLNGYLRCSPLTTTPAITSPAGQKISITDSEEENFEVAYSSPTSTELVKVTDCLIDVGSPNNFLLIPYNTALTVDLTATTANVAGLGSFGVTIESL